MQIFFFERVRTSFRIETVKIFNSNLRSRSDNLKRRRRQLVILIVFDLSATGLGRAINFHKKYTNFRLLCAVKILGIILPWFCV